MRLFCVLLLALLLVGCGGDDVRERVDRAREQLEREVAENYKRARDEFRKRRERFGKRIEQVLDDLERAVPRAERTDPTVRSRGRNEATTIDAFLTDVLKDIDGYWTQTFAASDLPEPRVRYVWVPPGRRVQTGCGTPADDRAAFYCPADDTIYVAQQFASDLYAGVARGLPGESSGFGRAAGDFAVAYVLAHEYAHNLQQELGIFNNRVTPTAKPFELQADCFAGLWGRSAYQAGALEDGDLEEGIVAAEAVGDDRIQEQTQGRIDPESWTHGSSEQRQKWFRAGFDSGDINACDTFSVDEV